MYCSQCGRKQPSDDARFCFKCGQEIQTSLNTYESGDKQATEGEQRTEYAGPGIQPSLEEKNLMAVMVGSKKYDYYFSQWEKVEQKKITWNWAAFFLSIFWLGYRRMYGMLFLLMGIFLVLLTGELILEYQFGITAIEAVSSGIGMAIAIALGMQGNALYYNHVKKKVKQLRERGLPVEMMERELKKKSSPNAIGAWAAVGLFTAYLFITFILVFALEIIHYSESTSAYPEWEEEDDYFYDDTEDEETAYFWDELDSSLEQIQEEVFVVLEKQMDALQNEDLDGYMDTIYYDPDPNGLYYSTLETMEYSFEYYDLNYVIDYYEFYETAEEEVQLYVIQTTTKISGPEFTDNVMEAMHTLRKQDGDWKFADTEILGFEELYAGYDELDYYEDYEYESPILVEITEFYDNSFSTVVEGELHNVSDVTFRGVQLRAIFYDDYGDIIDSAETYATSGAFLPNARTKYRITTPVDDRITNVYVEIIDYRVD